VFSYIYPVRDDGLEPPHFLCNRNALAIELIPRSGLFTQPPVNAAPVRNP
jgi:hypothetical protein